MTFKLAFTGIAAIAFMAISTSALAQDYTTGLEQRPLAEVQASAESGDGTAQLELGRRYYYVKRNAPKALIWFQKAAEHGVPWGEYETGSMYVLGEGAAADPRQALAWYKEAAKDGVDIANYDIGVMYWQGEGVARDTTEAAKWLRIAADKGKTQAKFILGTLYRDGDGVAQDYAEALKLLEASCRDHFSPACYALGDMIKQGKGTEKDLVVGQAWRIMGKYLEATPSDVPKGAKIVSAYLVSPDLTKEQNEQAQAYYAKLMDELGFNGKS